MSEELKFPDRASKTGSDSLSESEKVVVRAAYLPPIEAASADAYWAGLERRIMSRVRAEGAVESGWWAELVPWARIGLAAAGVMFAAAGLINQQIVAADKNIASYESVVDSAAPEALLSSDEPFASQYGSAEDDATAVRFFLTSQGR